MQELRGFADVALDVRGSVVSIGNFDGVHRGHQAVIGSAVAAAAVAAATKAHLVSVVCTFDPHTRVFLHPHNPPRLLETLRQRVQAIERLGVDIALVIPFRRDVAERPRAEFVRRFLVNSLRTAELHVSKDFTFGAGGRGNVEYLCGVAAQHGFELHVVPAVMANGTPISSTRIRDELEAGRVEEAATLLGRPFTLSGNVVSGAGRGRSLAAPTANLELTDRFVPARGVYVTQVQANGERHGAVTNVGVRPTFSDGEDLTVETHILDREISLYGERIELGRRGSGPIFRHSPLAAVGGSLMSSAGGTCGAGQVEV